MGSKRNVDMSATTDVVKKVESDEVVVTGEAVEAAAQTPSAEPAQPKESRSKKYKAARAQVDKTREYDAFAAVELVKRLSYSSFDGTLTADVQVKEVGDLGNVTFPHSTGKTRTVAIVDDALLEQIEAGTIEFDILLATPAYMPKLAKFARTLGPKGLMPNPKAGTLTAKPEAKKKELEKGTLTIKTERKQPVAHVTFGKVSMETKDLVENLQELMKIVRGKARKIAISASMSPSVKVATE